MELQNKTAIVTGAGRGIGKAVTLALIGAGSQVMAASDEPEELESLKNEVRAAGGKIETFCGDLTKHEVLKALVSKTVAHFSTVNILVNNAGVFIQKPFLEMPVEDWDKSFDINVRTQFLLDQLALDVMKEHGEGHLIHISSGIVYGWAEGDRAPYYASKAAIVGLARAALHAAKPYGVKVTTIYPDRCNTEMARHITWENQETEELKWQEPSDIAEGIMYVLGTSKRCNVTDLYMRNWIV